MLASTNATVRIAWGFASFGVLLAPGDPFQLFVIELKTLASLIPEPILLAHIKTSLLGNCYSSVEVCSSFELSLEHCIGLDSFE